MKKINRLLAFAVSLCILILSCPVSFAAFTLDCTAVGNTGAVLAASSAITAAVSDTSLAVVTQTDENTVSVAGVSGAVGIAEVTVTGTDGSTQLVEVPIGYTTFVFDGDTLTVIPGNSTNYEISGINQADESFTVTAVQTNADGSVVYENTDDYKLCVEIKKSGGTFVFTGESDDMSVAVKKEATAPAVLLLNGLTLASSFTSPITVKKGSTSTVTITALAGTVNTLSDTALNNADLYGDTTEDGGDGSNLLAESAVIKGKSYANITLNGGGTLNLNCTTKNAVKVGAYGSLTVDGLNLNVVSAKHGISCDNTLDILSGTIYVQAEEDGIRADPDAVDADAGCAAQITISGGTLTLRTGSDGIQSAQDVTISGGTFDILTGNGYTDSSFDKETMSCKGIKASFNTDEEESEDTSESTNTITITGGTFTLNTADDAIHSDGYIVITGGRFDIQTGDDGVHADTSLTLGTEGGENNAVRITVSDCYEGLEAGNVYIYSGIYSVTGSDDGINAAGDSTEEFNPGGGPGGPGQGGPGQGGPGQGGPGQGGSGQGGQSGSSASASDYAITIYGGKICVNVDGDGLDANGNLNLYGGTIVVWGQAAGGDNEPLDCDGTLTIQGATVFAAGSKQMTTTPSSASQAYVRSTSTTAAAGKTINVKYNGTTVYNILAVKSVNYILYSSPDMTSSTGWTITVDNSALIDTGDDDPCADGHTWNDGVYTAEPTCTAAGEMLYTCTVCGETKTVSVSALGHNYAYGYCTRCGAENPDAAWYVVTFVTDGHASVTAYRTQDTDDVDEENAQSVYVRNSDTGEKDITGNGQVNFSVAVDDGYILTGVTVTEGMANYKNMKVVDESAALYRLTKITGNITVTITTEEFVCEHNYVQTVLTEPTCTEAGEASYTCSVCGNTYTEALPALGHTLDVSTGLCARCGEAAYVVTFDAPHVYVTAYRTQDTEDIAAENTQTAFVRNSDSGEMDISGVGQVNFSLAAQTGYEIVSVAVTDGIGNYKNLKCISADDQLYRLTKITGDLTVTVTTQQTETGGWSFSEDSTLCIYEGSSGVSYVTGLNVVYPVISDFVETTGGWTFEVEPNEFGMESTGAKLVIYDETGTAVEEYYSVLFGDINGDGNFDGTDTTLLSYMLAAMLDEPWANFVITDEYPQSFAADANHDLNLDTADGTCIVYQIANIEDIDQVIV